MYVDQILNGTSKMCNVAIHIYHTVLVLRMAQTIWKETKQQPGTAGQATCLTVA